MSSSHSEIVSYNTYWWENNGLRLRVFLCSRTFSIIFYFENCVFVIELNKVVFGNLEFILKFRVELRNYKSSIAN